MVHGRASARQESRRRAQPAAEGDFGMQAPECCQRRAGQQDRKGRLGNGAQ